jgi:hypothetical protein
VAFPLTFSIGRQEKSLGLGMGTKSKWINPLEVITLVYLPSASAILFVWVGSASTHASDFSGPVVSVLDGDTLDPSALNR